MKRCHIFLLSLFFIGNTYAASVNYIQRGTATLTGTTTTVTLCNTVTLSQSILLFSCSNSNNTTDGVLVAGELSASTITFIRNGSNGTVNITWEVIEFSSGVSVQHGSTNVSGTTTNQSITAVSTSQSFVICTIYNNGSVYGSDDGVTAQLTSSTNLQFRCDAAAFTAYWQVVEYDSCSVQQLSISLSGTSATGTVTAVNTAKTMVIGNHRQSGDINADDMPRTQLTNSTTVTLTRVGSTATLNWLGYVVEFTDQTSVQHRTLSFGSGDASQTAAISTASLDRSIVYGTGNFGRQGSTTYATDDNTGYNWAYFEFNSTTQVQGTRAVTGSTAEIPFQVASFRFDQTSPPASHTDPTGPYNNVTLNRIRRGTETMSSAQTSISVTVDNMQTDSSLLIFSVRNPSTDPGTGFIGGRITNGTTITFSRATGGTTAIIDWQVFSFTNGVWVQRGSTTISSTTQNQAITSVNLSKSFPVISYTKTGNTYGNDDGYIADLTSSTNLQFRSSATGATVYWQVVEMQDALVRRSVISLADGIATLSGDFGCGTTNGATPGRSFIVSSQLWSSDLLSDDMPRVFLDDSLSVTATRVGISNTVDIVAYVVELFDGTTVQHGDITISGSDNSSTATITAVDPDYSGYIGPGHLGSQGSSTYTTDDDVGHNWTAFNLTNTTTLTAQRGSTGATTIAPYQVISFANYEVALPVSLVQFTGVRLENGEVLLRWKTASERNNAHFTIQRSSDGKTFSSIGSMPGNGTTNSVREYSFTDYTPLGGDLYYRLIQTDLNGTDHFSNILMIPAMLHADMQDIDLRIFPVPTRDVLELELENYAQGMASIAIIDMHGKIWKRQPWSPTSGRDYIRIDVNTLPCGAYVLQLQTQHSAIIRRFVKY